MITSFKSIERDKDAGGRPVWSLLYSIALAPYDLGVTQDVRLTARYDEQVSSYRIDLTSTRVSGQDVHWATTNRPFLERLRRILMRWRNLDASQHGWYVERGKKLFEESLDES